MKDTPLHNISKDDFQELLPSKLSIAILFTERVASIARYQHNLTHEKIYDMIESGYVNIFGDNWPFTSFDSFRKWRDEHKKEIYSNEKRKTDKYIN